MAALTQKSIWQRRLKPEPSLINKLTERCLGRAVKLRDTARANRHVLGLCRVDGLVFD
jgi:hypothetical protein